MLVKLCVVFMWDDLCVEVDMYVILLIGDYVFWV